MRDALKATVEQFKSDNLSDWAAALTYYGLLSLFPALIALVSIVGLVGDPEESTRRVIEVIEDIGPDSAARTFSGPVESIASNRGAASFAFLAGLAVAIWSASGYVGAFGRASDVVHGRAEGLPFWKQRPRQIAVTLALLAMAAMLGLGLVLSGPVVDAVAGSLGVGSTAVTLWGILKLPVMGALFMAMIGLLYGTSTGSGIRELRWFTPGSIFAVLAWAVASFAFAFYLGNFGSYGETYGTLGGVIALLVWLWITNLAILFGHALDLQLGRR